MGRMESSTRKSDFLQVKLNIFSTVRMIKMLYKTFYDIFLNKERKFYDMLEYILMLLCTWNLNTSNS